jgi:NADH:ubiquinone oxidoreductase subunit
MQGTLICFTSKHIISWHQQDNWKGMNAQRKEGMPQSLRNKYFDQAAAIFEKEMRRWVLIKNMKEGS